DFFFDSEFQETARNRDRLRNMSLPPLVAFAYVNQHGAGLFDHPARFVDIDLLNRRTRFVEDILRSFRHRIQPAACNGASASERRLVNLIAALSMLIEHSEPHIVQTLEPAASLSSL